MASTRMSHVFRHPKYYKELKKILKKEQAASVKPQASSTKLRKKQATSLKPQAASVKLKAASHKLHDS